MNKETHYKNIIISFLKEFSINDKLTIPYSEEIKNEPLIFKYLHIHQLGRLFTTRELKQRLDMLNDAEFHRFVSKPLYNPQWLTRNYSISEIKELLSYIIFKRHYITFYKPALHSISIPIDVERQFKKLILSPIEEDRLLDEIIYKSYDLSFKFISLVDDYIHNVKLDVINNVTIYNLIEENMPNSHVFLNDEYLLVLFSTFLLKTYSILQLPKHIKKLCEQQDVGNLTKYLIDTEVEIYKDSTDGNESVLFTFPPEYGTNNKPALFTLPRYFIDIIEE